MADNNPNTCLSPQQLTRLFEEILTKLQASKECTLLNDKLNAVELLQRDDPILSWQQASQAYSAFIAKHNPKAPKKKKNWGDLELKILLWLVPRYATLQNTIPTKMWDVICSFFPGRDYIDVKFEWFANDNSLFHHSANWSPEEEELLCEVVSESQDKNGWHQIAKHLFRKSYQKYLRGAKQCRERWRNYLDPKLDKGQWTVQEDKILLQMILEKGKKWAAISKCLQSRNEHSVKNRFKSLLRKYSKSRLNSGHPTGLKYKKQPSPNQELMIVRSILDDIDKTKGEVISENDQSPSNQTINQEARATTKKQGSLSNSPVFTETKTLKQRIRSEDAKQHSKYEATVHTPMVDERDTTREEVQRITACYYYSLSPNGPYAFYDNQALNSGYSVGPQNSSSMGLTMVITPVQVYRAFTGWADQGRDQYFV